MLHCALIALKTVIVCEDCGRLVHNDEAFSVEDSDYYYCQDCYNRLKHRAIKSYYYKPDPIFYGSGSLYMGVELEIDKGGEDNANAEKLLDIANCVEEKYTASMMEVSTMASR